MATPRLFVSSTCYDLQEIRFQLRNFIKEFGYEAVMSEFDDIFYNYETHVQDSCIAEINKCQLFILVIGNNYGSFYHQDKQENSIPDSVTLKEFRRALDTKIYKHIFINKYVEYDYRNYKRALDKITLKHFQEQTVSDKETDQVRIQLKQNFDKQYHFPYESYKYVFYFLDIINELKEGNAICSFESFADIKDTLRKQWASFMYESLTKSNNISTTLIEPLEAKIDEIKKSINTLFENKTNENGDKVTFDISNLTRETNIESLIKLQDTIHLLLEDVISYQYWTVDGEERGKRVIFSKKFTDDSVKKWLDSLKPLIQSFKLSKSIHVETIFKTFSLAKFGRYYSEIDYKTIFEIFSIYNSLSSEDQISFINIVRQKFNSNYEKPVEKVVEDDDLPF